MKVYIAASSREVDRVRAAQAAIAERGWRLTLDWLTPMLALIAEGKTDAMLRDEEAAEYAFADFEAICLADVVWYLVPTQPTKGAYVELGLALARGVPVVASGARTSIFEVLPGRTCGRDAVGSVQRMFAGGRVATDAAAPDVIARLGQMLGR